MEEKKIYSFITMLLLGVLLSSGCVGEGYREIEVPSFSCEEINGGQLCHSTSIEGKGTIQVGFTDQKVDVRPAPIPMDAENPDPYSQISLVTNFKVFEPGGEKQLTKFQKPFELRVEYTADQWERSLDNEGNKHQQPWLVYWSAEEGKWLEFDQVRIEPIDGDIENGGFLVVQIWEWVDPPIGIV